MGAHMLRDGGSMLSGGPYSGVVVLDLDSDVAGAYATMLLAELGAETVRVDSGRFAGDERFRLWNRRKTIAALDPLGSADRSALVDLVRGADVLVRTMSGAGPGRAGLSYPSLRPMNPRLVYCAIPPFGETGPLADAPADEGVVATHAGIYGDQGGWDGPPVYVNLPIASYGAAFLAAGSIGAALCEREASGLGQQVETSLYCGALAMQSGTMVTGPNVRSWVREATDQMGINPVYQLYECSDGEWLMFTCGTDTFWNKLCIALERFEWTEDPRFEGAPWNLEPAQRPVLRRLIADVISTEAGRHWVGILSEHDVPCDLVRSRAQFLEHPHAVKSGVLERGDDDVLGPVTWMSPPVRVSPKPAGPARARAPSSGGNQGPLAGTRVVDLTGYIAGSYATSLLADKGADVIKVESPAGDGFRVIGGSFQAWNRGKRGIVVDLRTPGGRGVVYDLVRRADVVAENFRPGAAARLGVDERTLRALRPGLVYLSVSGYGGPGPLAEEPAFDPLIQALTGAMSAQGTDGSPVFLKVAVADYAASMLACFGAVSGLLAQVRDGTGTRVETSLLAAGVAVQAAEMVQSAQPPVDARKWGQMGITATRRLYATRDGYIYLSCSEDGQFAAAAQALRLPDLAGRYPGESERGAADRDIARALGSAIAGLDTSLAVERLRSAGVMCAESRHIMDAHQEPQAVACGLSVEAETPIGPVRQMGPPFRFSGTQAAVLRPAPGLGEHTSEVLGEIGYPPAVIARLRADGAVA